MDWQITGHKKQLELLEKAFTRGKLAHAYVFAGPEGVGKKIVAKRLAAELLGFPSSGNESHFHPDLLEINSDGGIKIEQIRELTYKLSLKPYQAKYKVALIDNADQITTEAANALLKSLEEPKDYTFLFLITSNPNRLPKTILSRCQKINFGQVELPVEISEELERSLEFYGSFMNSSLADRLITAYDIADMETEEIKRVLEAWIMKLETALLQNPSQVLANKARQVMMARRFLEQNVNSKLLLTNLMINT